MKEKKLIREHTTLEDKLTDTIEAVRNLMKDGWTRGVNRFISLDFNCEQCHGFAIQHQGEKFLDVDIRCLECGHRTSVDPYKDSKDNIESYGVIQLVSENRDSLEHYVINEPLTDEEVQAVLTYIEAQPLDVQGTFFLVKDNNKEDYLLGSATNETYYRNILQAI